VCLFAFRGVRDGVEGARPAQPEQVCGAEEGAGAPDRGWRAHVDPEGDRTAAPDRPAPPPQHCQVHKFPRRPSAVAERAPPKKATAAGISTSPHSNSICVASAHFPLFYCLSLFLSLGVRCINICVRRILKKKTIIVGTDAASAVRRKWISAAARTQCLITAIRPGNYKTIFVQLKPLFAARHCTCAPTGPP
jgi:hypothetical protein